MKRITMIEPGAPGYHVFTKVLLPRLGLPILGAMLKSRGYEVRIFCQDISEIDYSYAFGSDMVMISTLTCTAPLAYGIADRFRSRGIPVVIGGPHATYMPDEALEHADFVMKGESEGTLYEFMEAWEKGTSMKGVRGLSCWEGAAVRHNANLPLMTDLDALPFPDLTLIEGHEEMRIMPVQTSRGCPFNCTFCSVTKMWGRRYRMRSVENVLDEIEHVGSRDLFFYDDNFTANKARAKDLLREMLNNGITPEWMAQTRVDVVEDRELLELMKATNCYTLYIGFESINPKTLAAYNKKQTVGDIKESIELLHQYGVKVHGMFVLGADEDDTETITETAQFAKTMRIDTVQFMILTPLPGTKTYQMLEEEDRIFTKDWSLYDGHHVVFEPKKMTPFELQTRTFKAMKKFYSQWKSLGYLITFRFLKMLYHFYARQLISQWESANRDFLNALEEVWKKHRPGVPIRFNFDNRSKSMADLRPPLEE